MRPLIIGVIVVAIVIFLLLIIFLAGPRVKIDFTLRKAELPASLDELDGWLEAKEGEIPDLIEGTEKIILWQGGKRERTAYSIVYLHGYTSSRQETVPTAELVAAALEANIFYTRLTGHGRESGERFGTVTVNEWLNDVYEAVEIGKMLGEKVIIMAISTSAPLTTAIIEHFESDIAALVFLSPNYGVAEPNSRLLLLPWSKQLLKLVIGDYRVEERPKNMRRYWMSRYRSEALLQLVAIIEHEAARDQQDLLIPTLVLYTENDKIVNVERIKEFYTKVGAPLKRLVNIEEAEEHIISGKYSSPDTTKKVVDQILNFLYNALNIE